MAVKVRYITDPACSWSWSSEPVVRKLMVEFGDELEWTWVMGGLARDYTKGYTDPGAGIAEGSEAAAVYAGLMAHWLEVADEGGMPIDPRLWLEGPIASTYPACMAVKAAAEQAEDGGYRYLRAVREGLMCFRRKLDTTEALVEEARRAGLDVSRFRIDLSSHAIVEAFGSDLEEARAVPDEAREHGKVKADQSGRDRVSLPSALFAGEAGTHAVYGTEPYDAYREAAVSAGARPADGSPPQVYEAVRRFGRMAPREVEAVCDLPPPRAQAELWELASESRLRPLGALTGHLFESP